MVNVEPGHSRAAGDHHGWWGRWGEGLKGGRGAAVSSDQAASCSGHDTVTQASASSLRSMLSRVTAEPLGTTSKGGGGGGEVMVDMVYTVPAMASS